MKANHPAIALFFFTIFCGHTLVTAEDLRILRNDEDAYAARRQLIDNASRTLDIAWFELVADTTGTEFVEAVADAAQRGVSVRLILDGMFDHSNVSQRSKLLDAGVQIRWFHPRGTGAANLMRRMHDKYLAADRNRLIIGSRNIGDVYFGRANKEENFLDLDLEVIGDFVSSTTLYYDTLWNSGEVHSVRTYKDETTDTPKKLNQAAPPPISTARKTVQPNWISVPRDDLKFLFDKNGVKTRRGGIRNDIYSQLAKAETSLLIVSPYFYPPRALRKLLRELHERGVSIKILTNSLESTNRPINHLAMRRTLRYPDLEGIEIREYRGNKTLHMKGFIVDDTHASVTSFNFNHRSHYFDTELALLISDRNLVQNIREVLEDNLTPSEPIADRQHIIPPKTNALSKQELRKLRFLTSLIPKHL